MDGRTYDALLRKGLTADTVVMESDGVKVGVTGFMDFRDFGEARSVAEEYGLRLVRVRHTGRHWEPVEGEPTEEDMRSGYFRDVAAIGEPDEETLRIARKYGRRGR